MKYINKATRAVIDLSCKLNSEIWEPLNEAPISKEAEKVEKPTAKKAVVKDGK